VGPRAGKDALQNLIVTIIIKISALEHSSVADIKIYRTHPW